MKAVRRGPGAAASGGRAAADPRAADTLPAAMRRHRPQEAVDFVVVGSGAAGGVLARELARSGFSVVVLEQGPWRQPTDLGHDELSHWMLGALSDVGQEDAATFRSDPSAEAVDPGPPGALFYARGVGGSSVHFTGNYWRFRPIDFEERSAVGGIPGAALADWPLTYEELEPYYTKVDWEVGVSGVPGPHDPPRSRPYPVPPLPVKSSGVLFERGCRALGYTAQPAPMAILSEPHGGRPACQHCGYCMAYGCEFSAKSSTLASMIPEAVATGRCEIRPWSTVHRVELDAAGRARGVTYFDRDGSEHLQRARAVVLAANGAETPRILFMSESSTFPDGLANSSGMVGRHLMFNGNTSAFGTFEHPLNEYKSVQVTRIALDWYDHDPARGFYGGGGLDGRLSFGPMMFAFLNVPPGVPSWGRPYKRWLSHAYVRTMEVACHSTSLPVETNAVTLDPAARDRFGRPAVRVTYRDHPDDLAMMRFLQDRAAEVLEAAGAERVWRYPVQPQSLGVHLLGTCRMGDDPASSVVDRHHRAHDVPNLFLCDGSSFVTSGRGQPTMTIQALAFRAAEHMARMARAGEV